MLTLFWKQNNISMPCQVICLSFERLHHEQCRFMCVDTVFEAIFNCDAMPGDLLTIFSKQFSTAIPRKVICVLKDCILNGADSHVC